jgi:hypothetical protein
MGIPPYVALICGSEHTVNQKRRKVCCQAAGPVSYSAFLVDERRQDDE